MTERKEFTQFEGQAHLAGLDNRELRPVSILYCDIVDSTGLSRRLPAEDYQDLIAWFQTTCTQLIEKSGGEVIQTAGDSVLACFGRLVAREDDPERAVLADAGARPPAMGVWPREV